MCMDGGEGAIGGDLLHGEDRLTAAGWTKDRGRPILTNPRSLGGHVGCLDARPFFLLRYARTKTDTLASQGEMG